MTVSIRLWLVPSSVAQAPLRAPTLLLLLGGGSLAVGGSFALTGSTVFGLLVALLGWFVYGNLIRIEARRSPQRARSRSEMRPWRRTVPGIALALVVLLAGWRVAHGVGDGALVVWVFAGFVIACEIPEWLFMRGRRQPV